MSGSSARPVGRAMTATMAAERRWQVLVIGGGPAGAACGLVLARAGLEVAIIERSRMPRGKLCGCCLSPRAVDELAGLGLGDPRGSLGAVPLHDVTLVAGRRRVTLPMPGGMSLSRNRLDASLVGRAVEQGCSLVAETTATGIAESAGGVEIACRTAADPSRPEARATLEAECVVLASGLADSVRLSGASGIALRRPAADSRMGLGATFAAEAMPLPEGELRMSVGRGGYCGIVRLEDGRIDVAAAVDPRRVREAGPADTLRRLLEEAGLSPPSIDPREVRGTPAMTHTSLRAAGRIFRTGDAAGYVEPFTGEGIGWALCGGRLLAEAIAAATDEGGLDLAAAAARYVRRHDAALAAARRRCRLVTMALRWPPLLELAVRGMAVAPRRAAPLVRLVTGAA